MNRTIINPLGRDKLSLWPSSNLFLPRGLLCNISRHGACDARRAAAIIGSLRVFTQADTIYNELIPVIESQYSISGWQEIGENLKDLPSTPIAQGRTAEIYSWDNHHILKLFRNWCPPDWVEYEARIARAIYKSGIPSPATGEIIEVNGRRGLIYERLDGVSMLQDLNARPWMFLKHARSLAELQVKINQQSITGLPSYKDRLSHDIRNTPHLSDDLRNKALAMLEALPDGKSVCHGDYHPGNVIITKSGPIVIDWMTASAGNPWADVTRTSLILSIGAKAAGNQVRPIIRMIVRLYHRTYLNRYRMLMRETGNELNRWMPVIAAARLNEDIIPEREALIKMVNRA